MDFFVEMGGGEKLLMRLDEMDGKYSVGPCTRNVSLGLQVLV